MACIFFFLNDTATTEIYTLSLHDALPISDAADPRHRVQQDHRAGVLRGDRRPGGRVLRGHPRPAPAVRDRARRRLVRSEEHTSELQSPCNLVCRLLLEKKTTRITHTSIAH